MARSIGDWFADHSRGVPDDAPDDEFVERQAAWDLPSSGTAAGRTDRRAPTRGSRTKGQADARSPGRDAPTPSAGVTASVRQTILAALRANPRADARSLAAFLTRHGTAVNAAAVAAVKDELASPFKTVRVQPAAQLPTSALQALSAVQDAVHANPHMGKKALVALLRARGMSVTRAEIATAIAQARTHMVGHSSNSANRLRAKPTLSVRGKPAAPTRKPSRAVKIRAAAQSSRTAHETPLCSSCGVRISLESGCRCSR